MKRFFTYYRHALLMVLVALLMPVSASYAMPDPTEQMKPFLEKLVAELKKEDFKSGKSCDQCKRIVALASEHFDYYEMSKRVMGKSWRRLTTEQKDQFVNLFTKLLQYAYVGKVEDYVDKKITFKSQRIKGKRAEVKTLLVDANKTIPVSYIMLLKDDKWMAYDIVVENVSLVRNYMEQIRSIMRNEKFEGLITQLKKKIRTLEEERNKEQSQVVNKQETSSTAINVQPSATL